MQFSNLDDKLTYADPLTAWLYFVYSIQPYLNGGSIHGEPITLQGLPADIFDGVINTYANQVGLPPLGPASRRQFDRIVQNGFRRGLFDLNGTVGSLIFSASVGIGVIKADGKDAHPF